MSQFVGQGEHLSGFCIRAVDEHEGGVFINEDKPTEVGRVELTLGIVTDHTIDDDRDAGRINPILQSAEGILPRGVSGRPRVFQVEGGSHSLSNGNGIVSEGYRTDKGQGAGFLVDKVFTKPFLTPLHLVNGVKEIGVGGMSRLIVDGPKVRDSKLLFGGRGQKEVAEGHRGGLGECFKLANGRLH